MKRRLVATLAIVSTVLGIAATQAAAQAYPVKPIRAVTGVGGAGDALARLLSQRLAEAVGQPVVVETLTGAGGSLAMHQLARAAPDGYTIGFGSVSALVLRHFLARNVPYDTLKDFTPIILVGETVSCVVAHPSLGFNTISDAVEYARRHPGKLTYGSSGIGTTHHLSGVLVEQFSDTTMLHVPYKDGAKSIQDLLGGQLNIVYGIVATMVPLAKAGKVRILAINANERFARMPDVPTIGEHVKGYNRPPSWNGFLGPAGLPPAVTRRLYGEFRKILTDKELGEKLMDQGFMVEGAGPEEFATHIRRSFELFGKAMKAANIQPE